jgi:hypothetical protein
MGGIKKQFVVNMTDANAGFFAYIEYVINAIICGERNKEYVNTPIVNFGKHTVGIGNKNKIGNNKFYDPNYNENMFFNYFRFKDSVKVNEETRLDYRSPRFWMVVHDNIGIMCYPHDTGHTADANMQDDYDKPYTKKIDDWYKENRLEANRVISQYFEVLPEIQKSLDDEWAELFKPTDKVVGVHVRGTDKQVRIGGRKILPDEYYPYIDNLLKKGYNKIFLATDDSSFYDIFNSKYPDTVKSLSGILRDVNGKNIFLDESVTNNYKKGLDVLKDCLGLAKTDFLLKSASGVSEFAIYFNTNLHKNSLNLQYDCREFLCNKEFPNE